MRKTKIWTTLTTGSVAVLALGTLAFAADFAPPSHSTALPESAERATATVDLPPTAGAILVALVGDSNPSTVVGQSAGASTQGASNANANSTKGQTEAAENSVSHGQPVRQSGTAGTRPGFGCGDTNRVHTGPPGRPGATPPPGCAKAQR